MMEKKIYVSTGALAEDTIDKSKCECYNYNEKPSRANLQVSEGDIIFAKMQGTKKTLIIDKDNSQNVFSTGFCAIKPKNNKITTKCLYYLISSEIFLKNKDKYCSGATQKAITNEGLSKIYIKLPQIEEQEKIINYLDRVVELNRKYRKQIELLDTLIKARFVEMFGNIKKSDGIRSVKLGSICETVSGGTPSTKENDYYGGDIPWISTVALGEIFVGKEKAKNFITEKALRESATHLIPKDSIMVGTRVGVGKCSINSCDMCTNQDINSLINIDESKFNKVFLKFAIDEYCDYFNTIKKGATILGITTEDLKSIKIPIVSLELQDKYVCFARYIDKLKFVDA